ncbi:MAG TPA: acetyl-CoA carboxylase carboxyltransferase subunit beta, partial [Blastocatellia bacterium]|nr:acetyl-CoA carboxylase carboxyltransferase subunit beta [Blastocatellia bacterium]
MSWFKRKDPTEPPQPPAPSDSSEEERTVKTEGLFLKCPGCGQTLFKREIEKNLNVCPACGHHHRIRAVERLKMTFDDSAWVEHDARLKSTDPLGFADKKSYKDRLRENQKATGLLDALITGEGKIGGYPALVCSMEISFVGGSLGSVMGEKITRAIERCLATRSAFVVFSASGGARMQEGVISLMQMAKISAALAKLDDAGLPYISVLTDPTTGGVTASFAMLG